MADTPPPEDNKPEKKSAPRLQPEEPPELRPVKLFRKSYTNETNLWALASSIGLALVLAIFIGLALGYWLDGLLGTKPWLTVLGLLLGVAAGFKNVFVIADRVDKKSRELAEEKKKKKDHGA